mgnify:CR=1 FL=1
MYTRERAFDFARGGGENIIARAAILRNYTFSVDLLRYFFDEIFCQEEKFLLRFAKMILRVIRKSCVKFSLRVNVLYTKGGHDEPPLLSSIIRVLYYFRLNHMMCLCVKLFWYFLEKRKLSSTAFSSSSAICPSHMPRLISRRRELFDSAYNLVEHKVAIFV